MQSDDKNKTPKLPAVGRSMSGARQDSNMDEIDRVGDELKGKSAAKQVPEMRSARDLEGADLAGA